MNAQDVVIRDYMLGLRGSLQGGIAFLTDEKLIYVCSTNVVIYHKESKAQEFMSRTTTPITPITGAPSISTTTDIAVLAVSPSRNLIAIAERGGHPVVNIYDAYSYRRKRMLKCEDLGSSEILNISFFGDSKSCLVLGGAPDYKLSLWTIEKPSKVLATVKLATPSGKSIYQADMNPRDNSVVCITGNGVLRFFRITDNIFRPVTVNLKRQPQNYVCHCWLSGGQVIVGTDTGDLIVLENFELKAAIEPSCIENQCAVSSMIEFSQGVVVGNEKGVIIFYTYQGHGKDMLRVMKEFNVNNDGSSIKNLAISPSGDILLCCTSNNCCYSLPISSVEILDEESSDFEIAIPSFHHQNLGATCIDVCVWKNIVVTGGLDKTVRVWNYHDRRVELIENFDDEVHQVSLHPSALSILVGTSKKVRMCSILADRLRIIWEHSIYPPGICQFSNGGQYFALCINEFAQIRNAFTCEIICTLRGHSSLIAAILFSKSDNLACTIGVDGVVAVWNIPTGTKKLRHVDPLNEYVYGEVSEDFKYVYAITKDQTIRKINLDTASIDQTMKTVSPFTTLHVSDNIIFGANKDKNNPGCMSIIQMESLKEKQLHSTVKCHLDDVTCILTSVDKKFLFTTGKDGSFCVFRIQNRKQESGRIMYLSENTLVDEASMEEKSRLIKILSSKIVSLGQSNTHKLKVTDDNNRIELNEVEGNLESELNTLREKYNKMKEERMILGEMFEQKMQDLRQSLSDDISTIEANNNSKIESEIANFKLFEEECEEARKVWEDESKRLVDEQAIQIERLADEFHDKMKREMRLHHQLSQEKENISSRYKKNHEMCEEDADEEIADEMQRHQKELLEEQRRTLLLKEENSILNKKYDVLMKDLEEQKETIASLHEKETDLITVIKGLDERILSHKELLSEKEETIVSKEDEISDFSQKNCGLEEYKVELSREVKELKDNLLDPKEQEILSIQSRMKKINCDLDEQYRINNCNQVTLGKLRLRSESLKKEIAGLDCNMKESGDLAKRLEKDLKKVYGNIDDHKALKASLIPLFRSYVEASPNCSRKGIEGTDDEHSVKEKQRWIENKIERIKGMTKKKQQMHAADVTKLKREHSVLKKELKELRQEAESIRSQKEKVDLNSMSSITVGGHGMYSRCISGIGAAQQNDLSDLVTKEIEEQNRIIADLELKALQLQQRLTNESKEST